MDQSADPGVAGQELGHESGRDSADPVDFVYLTAQTFGDDELERELLGLFAAQAARIVPSLPVLATTAQSDTAHLLKGSARGIGAWAAALAAEAYEAAAPAERPIAYPALVAAFSAAAAAIAARLAGAPDHLGPA